jgi:hypothetical protein
MIALLIIIFDTDIHHFQASSEAQPASCAMGTRDS